MADQEPDEPRVISEEEMVLENQLAPDYKIIFGTNVVVNLHPSGKLCLNIYSDVQVPAAQKFTKRVRERANSLYVPAGEPMSEMLLRQTIATVVLDPHLAQNIGAQLIDLGERVVEAQERILREAAEDKQSG